MHGEAAGDDRARIEYDRVIILRLINIKKMIFISLLLCDIIVEWNAKDMEWVNDMGMKLFLNDYYELLKILDENEATILEEKIVPLTQLQIASLMNCSKMKINTMFQNLQNEGFVEQKTRGKYVLTDNARSIIKTIDSIDKKITEV